MREMAYWGDAILLGVWGATLSSALGSILGAPRVLQALARDGVLPRRLRWLGKGSGRRRHAARRHRAHARARARRRLVRRPQPDRAGPHDVLPHDLRRAQHRGGRRAVSGEPLVPADVPGPLGVLAARRVGCVAVMFLINAVATVVAVLFVLGVYLWLERRSLETAWGDVRRGLWMAITRAGLMRLRGGVDTKNWRPAPARALRRADAPLAPHRPRPRDLPQPRAPHRLDRARRRRASRRAPARDGAAHPRLPRRARRAGPRPRHRRARPVRGRRAARRVATASARSRRTPCSSATARTPSSAPATAR